MGLGAWVWLADRPMDELPQPQPTRKQKKSKYDDDNDDRRMTAAAWLCVHLNMTLLSLSCVADRLLLCGPTAR